MIKPTRQTPLQLSRPRIWRVFRRNTRAPSCFEAGYFVASNVAHICFQGGTALLPSNEFSDLTTRVSSFLVIKMRKTQEVPRLRGKNRYSNKTMSPVLYAVINVIVRRIVLEKLFECQPLPVKILPATPDQLRHVIVKPQSLCQRQRLDREFDLQNSAHAVK